LGLTERSGPVSALAARTATISGSLLEVMKPQAKNRVEVRAKATT